MANGFRSFSMCLCFIVAHRTQGIDSATTPSAFNPRLYYFSVASSRAYAGEEQICDTSADDALAREDYAAAIALHRQVLRLHSDNALAHYHLGFAYGMNGMSADEIGQYLQAVKLGLDKWDLFLNLGLAYLAQNEFPKASDALRLAVLLEPGHLEAHFNLAIALEKQNGDLVLTQSQKA